ncbi:MAG: hypothetical protein JW763_08015 [candidate division Zixibacteria bacterium]|nr:hypothetical protein [candidate division Zixibacteria bacterium]
MDEHEFNLWKILDVIALRAKFIIGLVMVATIISVVVSFALPRWYRASTLLIPPKSDNTGIGPVSNLNAVLSLTSGLEQPITATPTDIYARILRSRTMSERVIDANNMSMHFATESVPRMLELLKKRAEFRTTDEGLLEIFYQDKDPVFAARVANSYAEQFDLLNRELSVSRAQTMREFIEKRLSDVGADLDSARRELEEFQREHKAVDLDRQTQLAMESAVSLKVSLAQNEIDLNVKEHTLSATHPDVISLKRRINEIREQINRLEFGGQDSSYLNLPVANVPGLRIRYAELAARVKVSETLYQMLAEQFEQARLQEKMTTPTISVLDPAVPPVNPFSPRKSLIVLATFAISLLVALLLALFFHYLEQLQTTSPQDYNRARRFFGTFFGWVPGIGKSTKNS